MQAYTSYKNYFNKAHNSIISNNFLNIIEFKDYKTNNETCFYYDYKYLVIKFDLDLIKKMNNSISTIDECF